MGQEWEWSVTTICCVTKTVIESKDSKVINKVYAEYITLNKEVYIWVEHTDDLLNVIVIEHIVAFSEVRVTLKNNIFQLCDESTVNK